MCYVGHGTDVSYVADLQACPLVHGHIDLLATAHHGPEPARVVHVGVVRAEGCSIMTRVWAGEAKASSSYTFLCSSEAATWAQALQPVTNMLVLGCCGVHDWQL